MKKTQHLIVLLFISLKLFGVSLSQSAVLKESSAGHNKSMVWASASVLSEGKWVKISTREKGVYKVSYNTLRNWGFPNPERVCLYGNGGYMLSKMNLSETDDLRQNPVWQGKDSRNEDCLFFYSSGTIKWNYYSSVDAFKHETNDYSDVAYYYLSDKGIPKNVAVLPEETLPFTDDVRMSLDYQLYEDESENLIQSGRNWYSTRFFAGKSVKYPFSTSNIVTSKPLSIYVVGAGRATNSSSLAVYYNGAIKSTLVFSGVDTGSTLTQYASTGQDRISVVSPTESSEIQLTYNAANSSANGWLDYLELNYYRNLVFDKSTIAFRYPGSVGGSKVTRFNISGVQQGIQIWDVTDFLNPGSVSYSLSGSEARFSVSTSTLREFVAFDPKGGIPEVEKVEDVVNQDLHAMSIPEMLIITHPDFNAPAEELADFHRVNEGLNVAVIPVGTIYNEFSSGIADAAGIRNFIRFCYERSQAGGHGLKYVLLLGDGSYDNKNLMGEGLNFIPTYQSDNSLVPTSSFVTDDFFVLLEPGEGEADGTMDLAIGRIPARNQEEAETVVRKIKSYHESEALGEWRNVVSFIADDEDQNVHMKQAEELAENLVAAQPSFMLDKIYFDAFIQETGPSGEKYPGVNSAINSRVRKGSLILNYTGHANEMALAEEKVLVKDDIDAWTNNRKLSVFITATCEFSRFDDDEQSGGEHILFNPQGGGVALFSTTRVVYSNPNFILNTQLYNYFFQRDADGKYLTMGEVMRRTKNAIAAGINKRNFTLLGDPALRLAVPQYDVVTTSVNDMDPSSLSEPLGALSKVNVTGIVTDGLGRKIDTFDGQVIIVVYDKEQQATTLGNGGEEPFDYVARNNPIYKGVATVRNGDFEFSFIVPKDISYAIGEGKIVYYATDNVVDAHGAFAGLLIGGFSSNTLDDTAGPEVELYLNTPAFEAGAEVGENSILYLKLSDASGINTLGTGIGHDITAVLDGNYAQVRVLNDYYLADPDSYTSGSIVYPLTGLEVGEHTLTIKVWDVLNNSTEVTVRFVVTNKLRIEKVICYPNPATDYANFRVVHNRPDELLDVRIEMYDSRGSLFDVVEQSLVSEGAETQPIIWPISNNQVLVGSGACFYRVIVTDPDGYKDGKGGKLIILKR